MDFTIDLPDLDDAEIVDASRFGLDESLEDNTDALNAAIAYCDNVGKYILDIPRGVYYFNAEYPIRLSGLKNFCFNGNGSEFIFSNIEYFRLESCENILVKDIIVDWNWDKLRLATLMKVLRVFECAELKGSGFLEYREDREASETFIDIELPEIEEADADMKFYSMNQYDSVELTPGTEDGKEFWEDSLKVKKIAKGDGGNFLKSNQLRIYPEEGCFSGIKQGDVFLVRHTPRRGCAFMVFDCVNLTYQNVTIYSSTSASFIIRGETHHVRVDSCKICIRPGSNRRMSTDADGFHVVQSKGYIIIENCDFSFMGDDDVNIHDTLGFVLERVGEQRLRLINKPLAASGDDFEFRRPDFSPIGVVLELERFIDEGSGCQLIFKDKIPAEVTENYLLVNKRFDSSNYIIRNNYFHHNRARGLLLQCSHGLVEGNRFEGIQGAAIYVMMETLRGLWYEGVGVKDLVIRNNVFENCNLNDWTSVIDIMAVIPDKKSDFPIFTDISIVQNTFKEFPSGVFYINKSKNVIIQDNTFINQFSRKINKKNRGFIYIKKSSDVLVDNNTWELSDYMPFPGKIEMDQLDPDSGYLANCDGLF